MSKSQTGPSRSARQPTKTTESGNTTKSRNTTRDACARRRSAPPDQVPLAPPRPHGAGAGGTRRRRPGHHDRGQGGGHHLPPSAAASSHLAAGGSSATADPRTQALSPTVAAALSVPAAMLGAVGSPSSWSCPATSATGTGTVLRGADGKPLITYIGAEYCPYSAAERWALAVALSRFGTFSNLSGTHSSGADVYPDTQTLSFYGSTYTSPYVQAVEEASNQQVGGTFRELQAPSGRAGAAVGVWSSGRCRRPAGSRPPPRPGSRRTGWRTSIRRTRGSGCRDRRRRPRSVCPTGSRTSRSATAPRPAPTAPPRSTGSTRRRCR